MKNRQRGITLIALIITIIVMLILVAVTVTVALNGGLFNNATDAKGKTQKAVEKEELISAATGVYDVDNGIAQSDLAQEILKLNNFETDGAAQGTKYVITGKSGTKWQVDLQTAEVKEYEEEVVVEKTPLGVYILTTGDTSMTQGVDRLEFIADGTGTMTMNNDSLPITWEYSDGIVTITMNNVSNPVPYNSANDSLTWKDAEFTSASLGVEALERGDIVKYNNEDWVVMYNDSDYGLQIARLQGIKYTGENIGGNTVELQKAGYNNGVSIINSKCQKFIYQGYDDSNPNNPKIEGAITARAGGSDPDFVDGTDLYIDNAHNKITAEDGLKESSFGSIDDGNKDRIAFNYIMSNNISFSLAQNSNTLLVPERYIFYSYDSESKWHVDFSLCKLVFGMQDNHITASAGAFDIYVAYGPSDPRTTETITENDNYTIFPVVKLSTTGFKIVSGDGTSGSPYVYSYN